MIIINDDDDDKTRQQQKQKNSEIKINQPRSNKLLFYRFSTATDNGL